MKIPRDGDAGSGEEYKGLSLAGACRLWRGGGHAGVLSEEWANLLDGFIGSIMCWVENGQCRGYRGRCEERLKKDRFWRQNRKERVKQIGIQKQFFSLGPFSEWEEQRRNRLGVEGDLEIYSGQ